MRSGNVNAGCGCGSFAMLLTLLFIGLKLTGFINWSWILVLSPVPVFLILLGGFVIFAVIALLLGYTIVE